MCVSDTFSSIIETLSAQAEPLYLLEGGSMKFSILVRSAASTVLA